MSQPQTPRRRRVTQHQDAGAAQVPASVQPKVTPDPIRRKKKLKPAILVSLVAFTAILALIVLIAPKTPIGRAYFTAGNATGTVDRTVGAPSSAYNGLVVSEIMASNQSAVPDETGAYSDWLELHNTADHAINLEGVGLSDRGDSIRFLFPAVTLEPDGYVVVFCTDTNQTESGLPFHAKFKLSSVGETVYVFDPSAYQIDSATYPIVTANTSWALMDGGFRETEWFSPGYENSEAGYRAYVNDTMVTTGELIINEIMADAVTGLADEDGELSDWIELYNTTDHVISLDNYALSNKENKPLKWRFPNGASIAPGGYYVVFCSGKDRREDATAIPHASFRISAEHDTVVLSDSHGRLCDRVTVDNLAEDCSWGRNEYGSFVQYTIATPGLPNTQDGANQMDAYLRSINPIGVYITEVMASNDSVATVDGGGYTDWVELYNGTQSLVDLSYYGLSDNIGRPRKWQFPYGTTIAPGEYKLVLCDGLTAQNTAQQPHTSWKILRAGTETVCLADPDGRVIDKMVLPLVPTNVSFGRTTGMAGFFYYDAPTPRAANTTVGFRGYAEQPAFTSDPGLYRDTVRVSIAIPEGTTVFYTTDGSIPTRNSKPYHGEIFELNFTTVLRARAFSDGDLHASDVLTGTFFVNAYHSLPIVSLVVDPDELWNPETGMLTVGEDVVKEPGKLPFPNTVYRKYGKEQREGHIEYYLLDGTQVLDQGMGIELSGAYSLDMPQKSFKLRSKSLYGEKYFNAALFPDRPYTQYKGIVLRNSGNDSMWTRLQDGFQSRLLDKLGTQVIHQAWKPVAVYLNGIYWGHMNMRERVDRFFIAQHEGLTLDEADQMDIVEANSKTKFGTNKGYKNMLATIKAGNPAKNPDDLQYILDNVDVDNYLEYIAIEMFFGNSDPGNIRYYRLKRDGAKWKWIAYDLDYGMFNSSFNSPKSYTKAKGMGDQKINNTILLQLLSVPEYKALFLQKLGRIFRTFTTEFMMETMDECLAEIEPEMQLHWARWGEENDPFVLSEVPTTADGAYRYWQQRVSRLRNVIKKRPNLLWAMIRDELHVSDEDMLHYFGSQPEMPKDAI